MVCEGSLSYLPGSLLKFESPMRNVVTTVVNTWSVTSLFCNCGGSLAYLPGSVLKFESPCKKTEQNIRGNDGRKYLVCDESLS